MSANLKFWLSGSWPPYPVFLPLFSTRHLSKGQIGHRGHISGPRAKEPPFKDFLKKKQGRSGELSKKHLDEVAEKAYLIHGQSSEFRLMLLHKPYSEAGHFCTTFVQKVRKSTAPASLAGGLIEYHPGQTEVVSFHQPVFPLQQQEHVPAPYYPGCFLSKLPKLRRSFAPNIPTRTLFHDPPGDREAG